MKEKFFIKSISTRRVSALLATLCIFFAGQGQILINEFLASNSSIISDPDYGEYSDWLELFNAGDSPVNLKNYSVTDNLNFPQKWVIQTDIIIQPGGHLLIWADDMDTGLHTNYRIFTSGEELGIYAPDGKLVDSISFAIQKTDISYGRSTDGNSLWSYFLQPTPGVSNNTSESYTNVVYIQPDFSIRGGFYSSPLELELSSRFGGVIRYTTDGDEPAINSTPYTSSIPIDNTTIVRARIFMDDMIPGPVITHSYFINENSINAKLPVVSLSTAPENFWDPVKGIYTQDFKPEWEIPVNIELFENNGSDRAGFNQMAGVKINGLYSWQLPQKMLGVYFKKAYGDGNLQYPLTPQRNRTSYRSFALRASGSDWSYTLFRDVLGQDAAQMNMNLDIMGFRPSIVYVNGEYLGIHNIREKVDADYIENNHNLEPGSFDLIENQAFAEAGDLSAYNELLILLKKDLSIDANFDEIAKLVDIENCTDLIITEMATRNTSINHNIMSWKPKEGGKWKWVVMDLDRGFFSPGSRLIDFYLSQDQLLFDELFQNAGYRSYFAQRLSAQLFATFNSKRMKGLIDKHAQDITQEIPRHIQRWEGTTSSYGNAIPSVAYWENEVEDLRTFVNERPAALLNDLQNYGFAGVSTLTVSTYPPESSTMFIDQLKVPGSFCTGPFLRDIAVQFEARPNPGFSFDGWYALQSTKLIPKGSIWKYQDSGAEAEAGWNEPGFNDGNWQSGPAEFGYGDGDEATTISFGGSGTNKHITYYFRNTFSLTDEQFNEAVFYMELLIDDGAVAYLNGKEVLRNNMPSGPIDYTTLATSGIAGSAEDAYTSYQIEKSWLQPGTNVLAVEVHQSSSSSSDISFNLELSCYLPSGGTLFTTNNVLSWKLTEDIFLNARFTPMDICTIPSLIDTQVTLTSDCSPYYVRDDITITANGSLTIGPGVEINMPEDGNIFIEGSLIVLGTEDSIVRFGINPEYEGKSWGGLVFSNTDSPSYLSYLAIEDASTGPDPVTSNAAISAFRADLEMDHMSIMNVFSNPIIARYSSLRLTDSELHSEVTGDLVNVKYGEAYIANCTFTGNDQPDTDAIDYDEVIGGTIRNCTISDFHGLNSDAIDIGEQARDIIIDSILVFNITDKGVSLGQHSNASITNSVFINCNMGIAVKDTSTAIIRNNVFYNNGNAIACYEKNAGQAGGNAYVKNSILSNSYLSSYLADSESRLEINFSLSDTDELPPDNSNLLADPEFKNPTLNDFGVLTSSPCILAGEYEGEAVNLGTGNTDNEFGPDVLISEFFINGANDNLPEYIKLYNPSDNTIDLSGYQLVRGVSGTLPPEASIAPGSYIYIADYNADYGWGNSPYPIYRWTSGRLANSGEKIQLTNKHGIVIDHLYYDPADWPAEGFIKNVVFILSDPGLDNHFAKNWSVSSFPEALMPATEPEINLPPRIYPNPTNGLIYIENPGAAMKRLLVYDISGVLRKNIALPASDLSTIDLSDLGTGIYFIKTGSCVSKIIVK
ncbi:lamin tail domain-containing protein [Bacteroidota bacterium]